MLCRSRVRIKPHMTVPQSESSGFFMVVLPMIGAAAAPRVFSVQASLIASGCFSDLDFLTKALDACMGTALRERDIEEVAGSETRPAQHDPARAVPDDAVAALQHCRGIQV